MRVLVVGSGGREHALVWKLRRSPQVRDVLCAPGNAGITAAARVFDVASDDVEGLLRLARAEHVDLTVVGPEAPLVAGLADRFAHEGFLVFGPGKAGARLEGDKAYSKTLMRRARIPTADFEVFTDQRKAAAYVQSRKPPLVVKASGLAAGKGVVVCPTTQDALRTVDQMMVVGTFGKAGETVVVEERLVGEEASILALFDGTRFVPFIASQDHKPAFDGDRGPNTGGMGAYAPAPLVDQALAEGIDNQIMQPLARALAEESIEYRGAIYAGIMVSDGEPKVLEFNCRFGDPETQPIAPLLKNDLFELLYAAARGRLNTDSLRWRNEYAVCVVVAAKGYPGAHEKGMEVRGDIEERDDLVIFHAGTARAGDRLVTSGGRVLGVTGIGESLSSAKATAYQAVSRIRFDGMQYRTDIADKGIKRLEAG